MSYPQIISFPEISKDVFACRIVVAANLHYPENTQSLFACRIVLAANHQYPGNNQRLFCLQKCRSRKSSISRKYPKTSSPADLSQQQNIGFPKYSKTFSPAELSQPKIINNRELFKNFFGLQNCRSRKSPISRNYSKAFSPAEQYQEQVIKIPEIFEDFFACRIVLAANRQYPENTQKLFRLQNCLIRKSSISRKYSKIYWPAELSEPHVISILKKFEDFFACRIVLTANHQYRGNIQRLFRLQNCLSCKSSVSRNIQRLFCLQGCVSRKSSLSRKYPKTSSPAELCQKQIINTPEIFKDFFACRNVVAANHQYPGNIQRLLRLQNCLNRKSSVSRKYSKAFSPAKQYQEQVIKIPEIFEDFFACRVVLAANLHYPENTRSLFRLQTCLSRKSSLSRKYPKTFSLAELSQPQIINIPKILKVFSPAELSYPQVIDIPEIFKDFFACRNVLDANHQYPGNIHRLFRLQD